MDGLIKIESDTIGGDEVPTVDARKLHKFLGAEARFNDWIVRRIEEYGFEDNKDFCSILSKSQGGRPRKEYHLTLDMAKELSMVERTDKGREARRYFIACEKIALSKGSESDDHELSTVKDRTPLYHGAVEIVITHRLSFGNAYQALNWFAGVRRFPEMTKQQVAETSGFLNRLLIGEATQKDFHRIHVNQAAINGDSPQMQLIDLTIPLIYRHKG